MVRRGFAVFALAALLPLGAFPQGSAAEGTPPEAESVELTIDEAVDYALRNNRTLKSADIDLAIKERAARYSWNVLLPTVTVAGTLSRANEYSPSSAAMSQMMSQLTKQPPKTDFGGEEERWSTVGSISAKLNLSLAYIWQIRAAKAEYETGRITWEQSQKSTVLNVRKLFYGLLLQQENLRIQKATLENKRQRMVQAQTSYRNGAIPELKLLQTQVDYQNEKPNVDSAEQSLVQSLDTFAFLLGMPVGTKVVLSGSIEPRYIDAEVESLLESYGQNDLNIRSVQGNIELLKLNLKALDIATWTPSLSIGFGWQPAYAGDDGALHFFKGLGQDSEWYDSGSLSFTLAWNITNMLPWSSNRQKVEDLKANIAKLELSMETLRENQKVEVRKAVDTLRQAKAQIDAMGRNVTLAQRAYDATYRSYRNGMTELLDLRDAEESLNKAKLGLLNQKLSYINALMDLENTLNTTLTETGAE